MAAKSNIARGKKVNIGDKYGLLTVLEIRPKKLLC